MAASTTQTRTKQPLARKPRASFSAVTTLARWRWRQSGSLLLLTGLGIMAAIVIMCTVPLLSTVTNTAGLRSTLNADPINRELQIDTSIQGLSSQLIKDVHNQVDPLVQQRLHPYLTNQVQSSLQFPGMSILTPKPQHSGNQLQLFASTPPQLQAHISLIEGKLPSATSGELELMLTRESALGMHAQVGDTVVVQLPYMLNPQSQSTQNTTISMRLVGIFKPITANDRFWNSSSFQPTMAGEWTYYNGLVSDNTLYQTFDSVARLTHSQTTLITSPVTLHWIYYINPTSISMNNLDDFSSQMNLVQTGIANKYGALSLTATTLPPYPYFKQVKLSGPLVDSSNSSGILGQFRDRISIVRIPILVISLQIIALILIFVSMMSELLVDRQADSIATLRSRGASSSQVFGSLAVQGLLISVLALIVGMLLALPLVNLMAHRLLPVIDQDALNLIANAPLLALIAEAPYALLAAGIAVLALLFTLNRATHMDVLSVRREAARTQRRPFWQRLYLDVVAAIIALAGYFASLYITTISSGGLLDIRTQTLVSSPLALIAPVFLLIACVLLFMRVFPVLLRWGSNLAGRGSGAATMLALAQMSRSPRQALRMTLLLSLATAFAIFTLVFTATQAQRTQDLAAYQAGADFSGALPAPNTLAQPPVSVQDWQERYRQIPGIVSASADYQVNGATDGISPTLTLQLEAVDLDSFAQTATWPAQSSTQSLTTMMQQLRVANEPGKIPAFVDSVIWDTLQLHPGSTFSVTFNNVTLDVYVLGQVEHIPTIIDNASDTANGQIQAQGGILTSYTDLNAAYHSIVHKQDAALPINHIWLKTSDDAATLGQVRNALTATPLRLGGLADRRALYNSMENDPLYLNLIGILTIGASTALLLALVGSLLSSWISARARLTSFAVLRALGTTPAQVVSVLSWEQAIIYLVALLLGLGFGALLSYTVVPSLAVTSIPPIAAGTSGGGNAFYALQSLLPTRLIFSSQLLLALIALIIICIGALTTMIRVVSKPSMGQALRLNED
ncbi:FtsX-like permease family protein [Ktedonobacter racemifer]|uniref:ABC3 transporter permease C-terminal domain-containing protein n=1 Tax=Ktedonobacter racemifer DSM 44963 TaxID=485913 RepID=D6TDX3_KTERA|nr:ABC transporter permease [Ktedonobacter racemifer]EFH90255.1 protein of unknown function DUF214 [Ktedonobacter racemifer DSM 44963]